MAYVHTMSKCHHLTAACMTCDLYILYVQLTREHACLILHVIFPGSLTIMSGKLLLISGKSVLISGKTTAH
jgi:hypothetical protein